MPLIKNVDRSPEYFMAVHQAATLSDRLVDKVFGSGAIATAHYLDEVDAEIMAKLSKFARRRYTEPPQPLPEPARPSWSQEVFKFSRLINDFMRYRFAQTVDVTLEFEGETVNFSKVELFEANTKREIIGTVTPTPDAIKLTQRDKVSSFGVKPANVRIEEVEPTFSLEDVVTYVNGYVEMNVDLMEADAELLRAVAEQ